MLAWLQWPAVASVAAKPDVLSPGAKHAHVGLMPRRSPFMVASSWIALPMTMLRLVLTACLATTFVASSALAEDWPQWREPAGQGIGSSRPTPTRWSETENVAWKTPLRGKGCSSPVILGEEIWLTTAEEKPDTPENIEKRLKANTGNQPLSLAGEVTFLAICLDKRSGQVRSEVALFTAKEPQWVH